LPGKIFLAPLEKSTIAPTPWKKSFRCPCLQDRFTIAVPTLAHPVHSTTSVYPVEEFLRPIGKLKESVSLNHTQKKQKNYFAGVASSPKMIDISSVLDGKRKVNLKIRIKTTENKAPSFLHGFRYQVYDVKTLQNLRMTFQLSSPQL